MHKVRFLLLNTLFTHLFFFSTLSANEDLSITDAWISEAPPTVSILAGYMNIYNGSDNAMILQSVSSPDFEKIEIHLSVIKNEMVSMEKQDSLQIPAKETIKLSPGNYHLMLFGPDKPLRSGDTTTLNFSFSNGNTQIIVAKIERRSSVDHGNHEHHQH